jgi:hypothetical protein
MDKTENGRPSALSVTLKAGKRDELGMYLLRHRIILQCLEQLGSDLLYVHRLPRHFTDSLGRRERY